MFVRAFHSALSTSSVPLASSDVFVNVTGGAPEPLAAAIALGFRTVFHVAGSSEEELMYALPTEEQERLARKDYFNYRSPEADIPSMGVLAAEAVRHIAEYLKNEAFAAPATIKVPLTRPLDLPPVAVYTYMPVLNQIVKRTVRDDPATSEGKGAAEGKEVTDAKKKETDAAKKVVPDVPVVKGTAVATAAKQGPKNKAEEEESDGGGDEEHPEENEDEQGDVDAELQALDEMQKATGKTKRKATGKSTGTAKKKLKKQ